MNLRPPRPERGALPDCATLRLMAGLITPASLKASLRETMTAEPGTRVLSADDKAIEVAARCLVAGGLVAFPTETVYGLGADARNGEAIARLYAAKERPAFNPLIAHVVRKTLARAVIALAVLREGGHAQCAFVYALVYSVAPEFYSSDR